MLPVSIKDNVLGRNFFSSPQSTNIEYASKAIWILGKVAIFFSVGFAHSASTGLHQFNSLKIEPITINQLEGDTAGTQNTIDPASRLAIIKKRNLFHVGKKDELVSAKPAASKKSSLGFRLVGTSVSSKKQPIAIVEDGKKKQDVFELHEKVFEKAFLKEIYPEKIVLERDGVLETLELEQGVRDPSQAGSSIQANGTEFVVPEEELTDALNNLPVLLSQARAVPYFRNGQSIGMRLYAIKAGSMYEKLGLKNSDVIKTVNESAVNDPAKALKLFEDLKTERSIGVTVEREGQDVNLRYQIR